MVSAASKDPGDDSDEDQRLPHHKEPKEFVSVDQHDELGVLSWRLDADKYETDEELKKIRHARGYSYLVYFSTVHLHTDEEKKDKSEKWVKKGAMISITCGIYHRFTLDSDNSIKAMRLFVGDPVWTPHNRPNNELPARKEFVAKLMNKQTPTHTVDATA